MPDRKPAAARLNERLLDRAAEARRRRWQLVAETFGDLTQMRVIDLGGEVAAWLGAPVQPREVILLNIWWQAEIQQAELAGRPEAAWLKPLSGDACALGSELADERFDLVYSNSVIEHVGGHERRKQFAASVERLGDRHWVQTPNRYFPIEPHVLAPGLQFAPRALQARLLERWPIGAWAQYELPPRKRMEEMLAIELLTEAELRHYFPESEIMRERSLGLTKSLIAVRR